MLFFTSPVLGQVNDSSIVIVSKDSIQKDTTSLVKNNVKKYHSPKKAALLSAVFPGAGQVYNKKYWKLPIIYAGAIGLVYSLQFNNSRYVKYRNAENGKRHLVFFGD